MNVPQQIAQALQRKLQDGHYRAGENLPGQRELAEAMGVSRASLREAISMLEALGLVKSQPGKGVLVTTGQVRQHKDIPAGPFAASPQATFEFRMVLEPAAAALAARHITPEGKALLWQIQSTLEEALKNQDLVAAAEADLEFHLQVARLSGNALFHQVARSLSAPIGHSLRLPFADHLHIWETAHEHQLVTDAITQGKPEEAHLGMLNHLRNAAARVGLQMDSL
jgi:GntR family transcriptional repressor for pyruvate dehydrogenase complex